MFRGGTLRRAPPRKNTAEDGTIVTIPPKVGGTVPANATAPSIAVASGIYGNSDRPYQVIANADNSVQLNQWNGTTRAWDSLGAFQYRSDGWWWSNSDPSASYRFTVASGTDSNGAEYNYRYLMKRVVPGAGVAFFTLPVGQQLAALPALDAAWRHA